MPDGRLSHEILQGAIAQATHAELVGYLLTLVETIGAMPTPDYLEFQNQLTEQARVQGSSSLTEGFGLITNVVEDL